MDILLCMCSLLLLATPTHSLLANLAIKTLSPKSKALTVSVEYTGNLDDLALAQLSSSLRKVDAATLWTPSVASVAALYKEQDTAKGDFPGPCPVIFNGDSASVPEAIAAGASAVVLSTVDLQMAALINANVDVLWRISSHDDVLRVVDAGLGEAAGFVLDGSWALELGFMRPTFPADAVVVAKFEAMQAENGEIRSGRALASEVDGNIRSLLLSGACVGDDEDLQYSRFAIAQLRSKMSSEFRIDGLTGAANGHFGTGGGSARYAAEKTAWKRQR